MPTTIFPPTNVYRNYAHSWKELLAANAAREAFDAEREREREKNRLEQERKKTDKAAAKAQQQREKLTRMCSHTDDSAAPTRCTRFFKNSLTKGWWQCPFCKDFRLCGKSGKSEGHNLPGAQQAHLECCDKRPVQTRRSRIAAVAVSAAVAARPADPSPQLLGAMEQRLKREAEARKAAEAELAAARALIEEMKANHGGVWDLSPGRPVKK